MAIEIFPQHLRYMPVGNSNTVLLSISSTCHLAAVMLLSIYYLCHLAIVLQLSNLQFLPFCNCNTYFSATAIYAIWKLQCWQLQYCSSSAIYTNLATAIVLSICDIHRLAICG
jgi:hypothetical protein